MKLDLTTKVTVFCRELGDSTLRELARKQKKEELLQRAEDALKAGQIGPGLEADLDTPRLDGEAGVRPGTLFGHPQVRAAAPVPG